MGATLHSFLTACRPLRRVPLRSRAVPLCVGHNAPAVTELGPGASRLAQPRSLCCHGAARPRTFRCRHSSRTSQLASLGVNLGLPRVHSHRRRIPLPPLSLLRIFQSKPWRTLADARSVKRRDHEGPCSNLCRFGRVPPGSTDPASSHAHWGDSVAEVFEP